MSQRISFELESSDELARLHLPCGVSQRLQQLLDRQDAGQILSDTERMEAEGLVEIVDLLALLRLRVNRELT